MIATDKINTIKPALNYVRIKDGVVEYTNSFVLLKRNIEVLDDSIGELFIHIDEWKKIGKNVVSLFAFKDGIATFSITKQLQKDCRLIKCIARSEIEDTYPDTSSLAIGSVEKEITLNIGTLELIIKQMKMEGKNKIDFKFTKNQICGVGETMHLFTKNN